MKRSSCLLLLPSALFAGGFTATGTVGYGLPFPGQYVSSNEDSKYGTDDTTSYEVVEGSFADGFRGGLGVGFAINDAFEVGIGGRYQVSSEIESKDSYLSSGELSTTKVKAGLSAFGIVPSATLTLPAERFRPYARFEGFIGFPKATSTITSQSGTTSSEREVESTGGTALGFGGALGVEYVLTPIVSLVGDVAAESWSWAPTEAKITKYEVDGRDVLGQLTVRQKKTKFVDSYTDDGSTDKDSPSKSLRRRQAYSDLAINLGVKVRI